MIAKVRIAPVERWCPASLRNLSSKLPRNEIAGFIVYIEPASMLQSEDCDGKSWLVVTEAAISAREQFGIDAPPIRYRVCEHMLEMD